MTTPEDRFWIPTRTYDFELRIEEHDLTNDIAQINIITSIQIPYITVMLSLFLDTNDIILKKIYGQNPIKLIIRHYGETKTVPDEQIELDLMYVSAEYEFQMKTQIASEITMKNRSPVQITTVCQEPFRIMNTYVNGVYIGKTVREIIGDLLNRVNATVVYDTSQDNREVIDQVLIPPITLYQALKYLNRTFGLFNGLATFYCFQDKPKSVLFIKNITSKMMSSVVAIIYQLSASGENLKDMDTADLADLGSAQIYYTFQQIESQYKGNTAFTILGPKMIHIVKPRNKLYQRIDINTEEFAKRYGLIYGGKTIYYDTATIEPSSRVAFFKDHIGYEDTQTHINANWSEAISNLSSLVVTIERNIFIMPLMKVGEAVRFISKIDNMKDLQGQYILASADIGFARSDREYAASAKLHLIRTNRTLE